MGNKSAKVERQDSSELLLSQHTNTIDSSQVENSKIFVQENKLSYCFACCNCFGLIKTQVVEIQLSWIDYTLRKLNRGQYRHFQWSDLMKLRLQNLDIKNFEELQAIYLNQIRMIISSYETNSSFYKNKIAEQNEQSKYNIFEYYEEEANTIFEDKQGELFTNNQKLPIIHLDQSFKYFKFILQIILGLKLEDFNQPYQLKNKRINVT
ncbi:unnamed protein product [Paramecium primaurelia]|uniref:Uncharacterized protein n=1 Tax=Paramecium primaurelia TaxID=5886 RepID=A0A8S1QPQ4_PARPR|nr:unnamed protein product [Paramecium primaurelia]